MMNKYRPNISGSPVRQANGRVLSGPVVMHQQIALVLFFTQDLIDTQKIIISAGGIIYHKLYQLVENLKKER
ncbi:MAG: hypothetical protein ACWGOL_11195 [Desulfuromonadales bacterium]